MSLGLLDLDNVPAGASLLSMTAHRLSRLLRYQIGDLLARHGELSLVDWRICVGLSQQQTITQKELVNFTKMQQGQVSRSLAVLEQRGLIRSSRCDRDKRARQFSMTDRGRVHFNRVLPAVAAYCEAIDQSLSPDEFEQFLEMAQRIAQASADTSSDLSERFEEAV